MPENKTDDLDLINLFERTFAFFKSYGRLIAACSLIGILAGFTLYKISPKQYASSLLLHSFTLTNTEHINIIENWNDLLKNGEYEALSKQLNCDPSMLKKVSRLKASEIQKLYIPNNPNGFMVEVMVKDNAILDSLGTGIVYGLEHIEYLKAKLDSKRDNLTQLIHKTNSEISKLDSLKKNIEYSINNNSQRAASYIVDISAINSQVISLNEKLIGFKEDLKFTKAVQVLHKFEKFERPVAPKLFKSLFLGLIGGFALGYILSLFIFIRRRVAVNRSA